MICESFPSYSSPVFDGPHSYHSYQPSDNQGRHHDNDANY